MFSIGLYLAQGDE